MLIEDDIHNCMKVLQNDGIILYPTDTVWGIGCDATNEKAVDKIFRLKKREETKSMIILLADEKDILNYTTHTEAVIFDYIKGISKPTTIIYEGAKNLAKNLIGADCSIGIRLVNDPFCKMLIRAIGKPIVSTSSNISGYPAPIFFQDIDVSIKNGVDYIVQHRQNDLTPAAPSSIIKLEKGGAIKVIRP